MNDRLGSAGSTELVPYPSRLRQIVLRHRDAVVVYDAHTQQLSASRVSPEDPDECPYCHRPFEPFSASELDPREDDVPFITPQYFRRLAASRDVSREGSRPASPPKILVQSAVQDDDQEISSTRIDRSHKSAPGLLEPDPRRISSAAFTPGYYARFFVEERELGRGGRGIVLLVSHVLDGVHLGHFACKRIAVGDDHQWLENVLIEVSMLESFSHPNLVSYRHVWLEDYQSSAFTPCTPHLFILQQYCNAGTLLDYVLREQDTPFQESPKMRARRLSSNRRAASPHSSRTRRMSLEEIFAFFRDIAKGLAHLHASGFVHRDLKPQNCLLHETTKGTRVLVSDFGEMRGAATSRLSTASGYTGTVSFAAPEVVQRDEQGVYGDFTPKSDIFSLGMIVYFMCFGRLPYASADLEEEHEDLAQVRAEVIAWTGLKDERRERADLPEKLYSYLQLLLSHNPNERPSIDEILQGIKAGAAFSDQAPRSPTSEIPPIIETQLESTSRPLQAETSPMRRPTRATRNSFHPMSQSPTEGSPASTKAGRPIDSQTDDTTQVPRSDADSGLRKRPQLLLHDPRAVTGPPQLLAPSEKPKRLRFMSTFRVHQYIRLLLFAAKVWTLVRPCAPLAARALFLYPLLALAAYDLIEGGALNNVTLSLVFVHIAIVAAGVRQSLLCERPTSSVIYT